MERVVCFKAGGRSAQHPLLKLPKAIPQRYCLVKAAQLVLQRNPHCIRLVYCLRAASLSASWLTTSLRIFRAMPSSCVDVKTIVSTRKDRNGENV